MNDHDLYERDDSPAALLVSFFLLVVTTCLATLFVYFALRGEARPITVAQFAAAKYAEAKAEAARKVAAEAERLAGLPAPTPTALAACEEVASEPWKLPARPDCDRPRLASTPRARVRKPRPKPERKMRFRQLTSVAATLDIIVGKNLFSYYLTALACEIEGRAAYRVTKCRTQRKAGQPDAYDLLIDTTQRAEGEPPQHSCECMGYLAHGFCKHTDAVALLLADGKLDNLAISEE